MSDYTKNPYLAGLIGSPVTVIPAVTFSADRDTEPGAQPWQATFRGFADDGRVVVQQDGYDARPVNGELTVTKHGLRVGKF